VGAAASTETIAYMVRSTVRSHAIHVTQRGPQRLVGAKSVAFVL
jgi:hypothetical protein